MKNFDSSCGSPDSGNWMAHSAGSDGPLCGKSKHSFDEGSEPGHQILDSPPWLHTMITQLMI